MNLQEPKMRPLTIEPDSAPQLSSTVQIEALTEEAEQWVQENAPKFGTLYGAGLPRRWSLYVYRGYDRNEVVEYLNALWDERKAEWPTLIDTEREVKR